MAHSASSHRIEEEGSSSDEEHERHGGGSPRHSLERDLDDGELMDVDEDNDLNGKDTASLQKILKSEVCPFTKSSHYQLQVIFLSAPILGQSKRPGSVV
jgi:hypothetical protein